jgi:hypothetical protein
MADEQKSPSKDELEALIANLAITRSPDYKSVYSNLFRTRVGAGEIVVIFSRITHTPSIVAAGNVLEEQVEVIMPWPQLKMFAQTLSTIVDAIDEEVGEIPTPTAFSVSVEGQRGAVKSLGLASKHPEK